MNFKENMGIADRILRAYAGLFFAVAYFHGITHGFIGIALLALTWALFATAIFGYCPVYNLLGLKTKWRVNQSK